MVTLATSNTRDPGMTWRLVYLGSEKKAESGKMSPMFVDANATTPTPSVAMICAMVRGVIYRFRHRPRAGRLP